MHNDTVNTTQGFSNTPHICGPMASCALQFIMVNLTINQHFMGNYTIMRHEIFSAKKLRAFLRDQRIATLEQLKDALATPSTMTVFRKLRCLGYLTSYSHRGQYYTLREIPRFNALGLWCCQSIRFSKYGNLQETAYALVEQADGGYSANELTSLLHVDARHALLVLERNCRLRRENLGERWIYFSRRRNTRISQKRNREESLLQSPGLLTPVAAGAPEFHEGLMAFFGLLDERQKRLFAGLQSIQLGHGGDQSVSALLELDVHTVAKGRREILSGQSFDTRLRKKGAGRKRIEKKRRTS